MNIGDACHYRMQWSEEREVIFIGTLRGGYVTSDGEIYLTIEVYEGGIFHGPQKEFHPGHKIEGEIKFGTIIIKDRSMERAKLVLPKETLSELQKAFRNVR